MPAVDDPDTQRGLYRKYRVEKINGKPAGRCFVLDYDDDPHGRVALAAYADSCAVEFTQLAADLYHELGVEAAIGRCENTADDLGVYLAKWYQGRWAVICRGRVVAVGNSLREALEGSGRYPDAGRVILYVPREGETP